jgi:hypothetical protein
MQRELLREDGPKCGCGRSPSGYCIGWHSLSESEYKDRLEQYKQDLGENDK